MKLKPIFNSKCERSHSTIDYVKKVDNSRNNRVEYMIAKTKPNILINTKNLYDLSKEWESQTISKANVSSFQIYLHELNQKYTTNGDSINKIYKEPKFKFSHFRMFSNIKRKFHMYKFVSHTKTSAHPFKQEFIGTAVSMGFACYIFPSNAGICSYDIKNRAWEKHNVQCDTKGHSALQYKGTALIVGGNYKRPDCIALFKSTLTYKHLPYLSYRRNSAVAIVGAFIRGIDANNKVSSSIFMICLESFRVKKLKPTGNKLAICNTQASCIIYNRNWSDKLPVINWSLQDQYIKEEGIYVFGGLDLHKEINGKLYCFNIFKLGWTEILTTGQSPCARYGHISAYLEGANALVIGGGCSGCSRLSDVFVLDISSFEWYKIESEVFCFNNPVCSVGDDIIIFSSNITELEVRRDAKYSK